MLPEKVYKFDKKVIFQHFRLFGSPLGHTSRGGEINSIQFRLPPPCGTRFRKVLMVMFDEENNVKLKVVLERVCFAV